MKNNTIVMVIVALLIAGLAFFAITKDWPSDSSNQHGSDHSQAEVMNQTDTHGGDHDMGSMDEMHSMEITSEKAFIEEMIPHHQEAIDTSKELLERGVSSDEMKILLQGIITSQEKEITNMKSWYKAWYGTAYQDKGTYKPMMRDLSSLSGAELEKAFLNDMIMHHMGAIMMAQSVAPYIEHKEMQALAEAIAADQSTEIITMRVMLKTL